MYYKSCKETLGYIGDLIDNDCDGVADEDVLKSRSHSTISVQGVYLKYGVFCRLQYNFRLCLYFCRLRKGTFSVFNVINLKPIVE